MDQHTDNKSREDIFNLYEELLIIVKKETITPDDIAIVKKYTPSQAIMDVKADNLNKILESLRNIDTIARDGGQPALHSLLRSTKVAIVDWYRGQFGSNIKLIMAIIIFVLTILIWPFGLMPALILAIINGPENLTYWQYFGIAMGSWGSVYYLLV